MAFPGKFGMTINGISTAEWLVVPHINISDGICIHIPKLNGKITLNYNTYQSLWTFRLQKCWEF